MGIVVMPLATDGHQIVSSILAEFSTLPADNGLKDSSDD